MHDSAVASVSPRSRQALEHERLDRLLAPREEVLRERLDERRLERLARARSAPGATSRSTWISKSRAQIVTSTPSPSPPAASSAWATDRLGDAVEAEDAPRRRRRAGEQAAERLARERGRPERLQLRRRAGQGDDDAPVDLEHERGRGAGDAGDESALGEGRLLAHAVGEVGVGPAEPVGEGAREGLDRASSSASRRSGSPAAAREQLDGAVVVGRPEPARDDEQVAREPVAERALELVGGVADDPQLGRLDPERRAATGRGRAR